MTHAPFPFTAFLDYCNFSMPQVYWIDSEDPTQQLQRSISQYQALKPGQPIVPTGSAFAYGTWAATPQQLVDFFAAARQLSLPGANFWEMATAQDNDGSLWSAIKDYNWTTGSFNTPAPNPTPAPSPAPSPSPVPSPTPAPQPSPKPDIITRYLVALNNGNPNQPTVLYEKNVSKHINAGKIRQGRMAIFEWYNTLLKKTLPNAKFSIVSQTNNGNTYQLKWSAKSSKGKVQNGKDTIVMSSTNPNLIIHHVTEFSVSKSLTLGPLAITWEPSGIGSISE